MSSGRSKDELLFEAAEKGNLVEVERSLANGANVNWRDQTGQTTLHDAAQHGHEAVVKLLLEYGANVNASFLDEQTPLHLAAQHGHEDVVKLLLENGANVNASSSLDRQTPLHLAAELGDVIVVEMLSAAGADLLAIDWNGETPRDVAAARNHTAVVNALNKCAQDRACDSFCAGDHATAEQLAAVVIAALNLNKSAYAWIGHSLQERSQLDQALAVFDKGAKVDPTDVDCIQGIEDVKLTMEVAKTFRQEDLFARLAQDESMRDQLGDESFVYMVKSLQANPNQFNQRDEGMNRVFQYLQRFSESIVRDPAPQPPVSIVQGPCQLPVVWTISIVTDKAILPIEEQVRGLECRIGVVNTPSAECSFDELHFVAVPVESEVVALVLPFVRASRVLLDVLDFISAYKVDVSRLNFVVPDADSIEATVNALETIHKATTALPSETLLRELDTRLIDGDVTKEDLPSSRQVEDTCERVKRVVMEFGLRFDTIERVTKILDSIAGLQSDKTLAIVGGLVRSGDRSWKCHGHGSSSPWTNVTEEVPQDLSLMPSE